MIIDGTMAHCHTHSCEIGKLKSLPNSQNLSLFESLGNDQRLDSRDGRGGEAAEERESRHQETHRGKPICVRFLMLKLMF